MYLLDTNVLSELRRLKPHGGVVAWLEDVEDTDLYLSAVSVGEIQIGIELTRRQDQPKAAELQDWLNAIIATRQILPMDAPAFRRWAQLMHGRSNTLIEDAMIAATALVHGLTLVTRNIRDFQDFGVALIDPFSAR
ncbi:type II toxin-antitoxin system VapC family toxin [Oceanibaculum pacificum]|uniref:Ribonuclease VapC n=1 Tax=Oceanibaculum pacificum TaxID=580166 RepID=A0A154VAB5_9PROT|nr:type II toxin-antitoxin system VapC family toxin [Oceanibaculum pacificum]KZC98313.1 twitching motility protein PilT [Oceanibaculum pacificum]